jgi:signal transduction histidine kinase
VLAPYHTLFTVLVFCALVTWVKHPLCATEIHPFRYVQQSQLYGIILYDSASSTSYTIHRAPLWKQASSTVVGKFGGHGEKPLTLPFSVVTACVTGTGVYAAGFDGNGAIIASIAKQTGEVVLQRIALETSADTPSIEWIAMQRPAVRIGTTLLQREKNSPVFSVIEQRVVAVAKRGNNSLMFVQEIGGAGYLSLVDNNSIRRSALHVPLASKCRVVMPNETTIVVLTQPIRTQTLVSVLHTQSLQATHYTVHCNWDVLAVLPAEIPLLVRAELSSKGVEIVADRLVDNQEQYRTRVAYVASAPTRLLISRLGGQYCTIITTDTHIATLGVQGDVYSVDLLSKPIAVQGIDWLEERQHLLCHSESQSIVFVRESQPWWWFWRFVEEALGSSVYGVLCLTIIVLIQLYRKQQRVLHAMIHVPGAGVVLVFDSAGKLTRTNPQGASVLGISPQVPMRRMFRWYMVNARLKELQEYTHEVLSTRSTKTQRILLTIDENQREYMFSSVVLRGSFARFRGVVLTGVDITEALERKRLVNWAQLAHDMQTNLSTIRLNAEQLDDMAVPAAKERKRRILFQVGVLIQRVRDIVSVGRNSELVRVHVHSAELCTELRQEFDPILFPNVHFAMKLRGTMMFVDRLKVSRAVRNAVENGIKALRGAEGTVEIATWFDRQNVYIKISDTGAGMDSSVLENMMKPYFTTAKDGSGTGIGTMIMQHVVDSHGGSLRVTSQVGVGTQVVFQFPIEETPAVHQSNGQFR